MTLVYGTAEPEPGQPGTHALVIGVGGYHHLPGGDGPLINNPMAYNLGQLTSPAVSAVAFTELLLDEARGYWPVPLASVDVLVSTPPGVPHAGGPAGAYDDPTMPAVTAAFNNWFARCHSDENNIAVLYFCGHGLQRSEQLLLTSDFGQFPNNHFAGAFAFDSTRRGFYHCRAKTQCFFVDACRESTPGTRTHENLRATALVQEMANEPRRCSHDLTLRASAPGERAFALPGDVSFFAKALLAGFEGGAANVNAYGDWVVTNESFTAAIEELLAYEVADEVHRQVPAHGEGFARGEIYRTAKPPTVRLTLSCNPAGALSQATLAFEPASGGARTVRDPLEPSPWQVTVSPGTYRVEARFLDGGYDDAEDEVVAHPPPARERILRVPQVL